ncbi:isoprenylcysteine carboxylmethyltransferase family protein [Rhizobacter sp. Root1221]|uniref:methyltransferase family protein n=1 Tax=Rhizobacter sp. Root1221 TaxID=1736433 RepID=UPI0006F9B31F|nr:methyltransferase [Rhizobacter sp. Root1221]KQV90439.1 hypothetical protein ASC87_28230 [Rhizobacter sp. Root1221]
MSALLDSPRPSWFQRFTRSQLGDKLMALVLVAWMTNSSIIAIRKDLGLALTLLFAAVIVLNVQVLFRRVPAKVTSNPWFWLLTVAASGHIALYALLMTDAAPPLTPHWLNNTMAVVGMSLMVWARATMGLNFGFVPALRGIVTTGPFRFVRHPVYTSLVILLVVNFLDHASVTSFVLGLSGVVLWVLKVFAEESFLRHETAYRDYMAAVRWRLVPGVF